MQLSFFSSPTILPVLEHNFRTDERVIRNVVIKQKPFEPLPKAKGLKKIEEEIREHSEASR